MKKAQQLGRPIVGRSSFCNAAVVTYTGGLVVVWDIAKQAKVSCLGIHISQNGNLTLKSMILLFCRKLYNSKLLTKTLTLTAPFLVTVILT